MDLKRIKSLVKLVEEASISHLSVEHDGMKIDVKKEFSAIGSKLMLEVRGKKHEAIVAELPFYKKSYVK